VDRLVADAERDFSWLYHGRSEGVTCELATQAPPLPNAFPGSEYIANAREAKTDGIIRLSFRSGEITTCLAMAAVPGTRLLLGDGPGASVDDRVPLAMITRRGNHASFAAVLEPVRHPQTAVTDIRVVEGDGTARLEVRHGEGTDAIRLDGTTRVEVRRNDEIVLGQE
jgi:hypothetical protein